jgi:hypothetical protein
MRVRFPPGVLLLLVKHLPNLMPILGYCTRVIQYKNTVKTVYNTKTVLNCVLTVLLLCC